MAELVISKHCLMSKLMLNFQSTETTLVTLMRGFDLNSDEERRTYFKQKGIL